MRQVLIKLEGVLSEATLNLILDMKMAQALQQNDINALRLLAIRTVDNGVIL